MEEGYWKTNSTFEMLTILGDGQPFLGVNVPHLDCVGCGLSEGRIVEVVVVRSVAERNEIPLKVRGGGAKIQRRAVVRRLGPFLV